MRRIAAEAELSLCRHLSLRSRQGRAPLLDPVPHLRLAAHGAGEQSRRCRRPTGTSRAAVRNHIRHFGENMHELKVCARELETLEGEAYDAVHERRRAYFEAVHQTRQGAQLQARRPRLGSWLATANLFGMLNWFYQWYDAGRSRVSLDDLAAQQTALFLDGYIASTSGRRGRRGNDMRYAETGFNLEVDLSRGNIERVPPDPRPSPSFTWGASAPTPGSCGTGSAPRSSPSTREPPRLRHRAAGRHPAPAATAPSSPPSPPRPG